MRLTLASNPHLERQPSPYYPFPSLLFKQFSLDYETKTSYTGLVNYTVNGNAVAVPVTINVNDLVAGAPCAPGTLKCGLGPSTPTAPAYGPTSSQARPTSRRIRSSSSWIIHLVGAAPSFRCH